MGICLVLGGGGARGIAHVGAIRVLVENNIPIDSVIGTSAGAMIGGLFAYHPDIDALEDFVLKTGKKHLVKRSWSTIKGYSNGKAYVKKMNQYLNGAEFSDLKIPFTALAADINTGELVPINEGSVAMAQLCSSALPPIYAPIHHMGRQLIDGGCIESVGADYAHTITPEKTPIIAVQVGINFPEKKAKGLRSIMYRFVAIRSVYFDALCARSADVIVRPDIPGDSILDDTQKEDYIQKGREAALAQLPNILDCLALTNTV